MESAKDVGKNVEVNEHKNAYLDLLNEVNGVQLGGNFDMPKVMNSLNHFFYLTDKATPKKPIVEVKETKYKKSTIHEHIPHCPICNTRLFLIGACCPNNECRQAIDWSKDE